MNLPPQRSSNLFLCVPLILVGVSIMLGTVVGAFYLNSRERVNDNTDWEAFSRDSNIEYYDLQIRLKDSEIEAAKGKFGTGRIREPRVTPDEEKIKQLEEEKRQLEKKRDALVAKSRAPKTRSLSETYEDYSVGILLGAVLPLGLFSFFIGRFLFAATLPARNPLSLTDFERKCVLFVAFSIVFSAFGFFVFLWIVSIS